MEFCKNCNSILYYYKDYGLLRAYCKKCRTSRETLGKSFKESTPQEKKGSGVISAENSSAGYDNRCKKCGHVGAEIIDVGVLISDEDQLILLKCGKCGFSERLGRKVT